MVSLARSFESIRGLAACGRAMGAGHSLFYARSCLDGEPFPGGPAAGRYRARIARVTNAAGELMGATEKKMAVCESTEGGEVLKLSDDRLIPNQR